MERIKMNNLITINLITQNCCLNLPEITVIAVRADIAPRNTVSRECFIAMIAAMKNVLSPISETMITENVAMNPWRNA